MNIKRKLEKIRQELSRVAIEMAKQPKDRKGDYVNIYNPKKYYDFIARLIEYPYLDSANVWIVNYVGEDPPGKFFQSLARWKNNQWEVVKEAPKYKVKEPRNWDIPQEFSNVYAPKHKELANDTLPTGWLIIRTTDDYKHAQRIARAINKSVVPAEIHQSRTRGSSRAWQVVAPIDYDSKLYRKAKKVADNIN